ncbi:MAG: hypothetical protein H8D22_09475 [Candidatus Cloacimonetes bacterium]|nr:hypothetical protein [Candidatus Cloacimonadota bacterium]
MERKMFIILVILIISVTLLYSQGLTDIEIKNIENDAYSFYEEGCRLEELGDLEGAINNYEMAVEKYESIVKSKNSIQEIIADLYNKKIAYLYYRLKKDDKYIINAEKALEYYQLIDSELYPRSGEINELYKNLSIMCKKIKQYNKAIKYYNLRLQKKPDDSKVILALNTIYEALGNKSKALQVLIDFDKNYSKYKIKKKIAKVYEEKNDIPNAIKYYSEAFEINNKKVDILEKIALLYHNIGQDTSAIKIYNDYIATKPEDYILRKVYKNLGGFYQNIGDIDNALEAFEQSDTIKFDKEISLILGQLYYERGYYKKAKDNLSKVRETDPTNPNVHYYFGLIYRKEGKSAEALAEFEMIKNHHTLGPAAKQQIEYIKKSE